MQRLIIGTYPTGEAPGSGEGLWEVFLESETGALTGARQLVATPSPSFVALHPDGQTLFAVAELDEGVVTSFTLTADAAVERESRPTGGVHPCHVVAREREVWVTNYSSGTFTTLGLDDAAAFTGQVQTFGHAGSGPDSSRQEGPHAHFCLPVPTGDGAWVVDLGTDEIRRYPSDPAAAGLGTGLATGPATSLATTLVDGGAAAKLPVGAGPRHAAVHPSGVVFVVGELDSRVHLLRPAVEAPMGLAVEALTEAPTGATTEPTAPQTAWEAYASAPACVTPDQGTGSYPSHIALSADGTRLYVAVRGPDVLSTFVVTPDGASITHLADTPIGGVWPRHFAVLPGRLPGSADDGGDLVVVANQNSSTLAVLRIDPVSGLGELTARLDLPAPACVLPV